MTDEELAFITYKLLKNKPPAKTKCGHHEWHVYTWGLDAKAYVRDWRVAGAVMEKCWDKDLEVYSYANGFTEDNGVRVCINNQSETFEGFGEPPRAIIEACVEAVLTGEISQACVEALDNERQRTSREGC